jgi:hypothetical protein
MATEQLFAVIRTRGVGWGGLQSLEGQPHWKGHAAFTNGLAKEGFVSRCTGRSIAWCRRKVHSGMDDDG